MTRGRDVRGGFVPPAPERAFNNPTDLDEIFGPLKKFELSPEAKERLAREKAEREEKHAETQRQLEAAKPGRWLEELRKATPLPESELEAAFGPLKNTDAHFVAREWLKGDQKRGVCIRGPVGCGKTFAALLIAKAWVEPGIKPAKDFDGPSWLYGHEVSWLRPDDLVSAALHAYEKGAPALHKHVVLDDLGRETKTSFPEALCRLLEDGHMVVITTNLTKTQMRQRYEPRVLSRLGHCLDAYDVKGADLRMDGGF